MTNEQLEVIVGLLAGMQTAIVHISNIVAHETSISPNDLAKSFETLADSIPADAPNRHLIQLCLKQVASGIQSSGGSEEWGQVIGRLLH